MSKKSQSSPTHTCQLFEFLLRMTSGTELFAYTVTGEDADRLSTLFSQFDVLAPDRQVVEFACVSGRVVHLNLNYLVAVSRLELVGEAADQELHPVRQVENGGKHSRWHGIYDPEHPPDVALFVDGLTEPLICEELAPDALALATVIFMEELEMGIVRFLDEEEMRTRFVPARKIILMDTVEYHNAEPA